MSVDEGTPGNPDSQEEAVDWQKRYTDLQSQYTRTSQEAAELRQYQQLVEAVQSDDPEAQAAAAEALGLAFVGQETDPQTALEQRLAKLETQIGSQTEQQQLERLQEQDADYMDAALEGFETKLGRELTKDEVELLVGHALINRTEEGQPGIETAIGLYEGIDSSAQSRWASSKRVTTPTQGREGTEKQDLEESHSARVAHMMQRFDYNNRR